MGRIRDRFAVDSNTLKVTQEQTISSLGVAIWKTLQRKKVATNEKDIISVEKDGAENHSLVDKEGILGVMGSGFESSGGVNWSSASSTRSASAMMSRLINKANGHNTITKKKAAKLVFGATGLVGSHIVYTLLKAGVAKIYCIVRAPHSEAACQRIESTFKRLHLWQPGFKARIHAIAGEISKPSFGLSPTQYEELLANVGEVVHAAGTRYWLGERSQVAANASGTCNIIAFARKGGAAIHYTSTAWLDIYETGDKEDKKKMSNMAYINIKRQGEELVQFASTFYGIPCSIYRLPAVSVSTKGGFEGDLVGAKP